MKRISWIVLVLWVLRVEVQAASFDCAKAATNNEKLICSDSALSKLDADLNSAYKAAIQNHPQADSIKQKQKQWIKERNACSDTSCLKNQYIARIAQLSSSDSGTAACRTVIDYVNRGELRKLYVPEDHNIQTKVRDFFGQIYQRGGTTWLVDLDDDGVLDPFLINVEGTAHISYGYAISGKTAGVIVDVDSDGSDLTLLAVTGKYYVLTSNRDELKQLLHMTDGKFDSVCRFIRRDKPFVELYKGKDISVCTNAATDNVTHVNFRPVDNETVLYKESITGLARADLNNDNKLEDVALVDHENGAGPGCSSLMVRVVNDSKTKILDGGINKIIESHIGGCTKQGVFTYKGLTYIDEQTGNGWRSILLIKDGKGENVCEFRGHFLFDVYK